MKNKEGFILYKDLIHTVELLNNSEAGKLFKLILSYVNDEDPKVEDRTLNLVFEPIKRQLKRDLKHWESIKEKRREYGRKGGLAKASNTKQRLAKSSKLSSYSNSNSNSNSNKYKPTQKEVEEYLKERIPYLYKYQIKKEGLETIAEFYHNKRDGEDWIKANDRPIKNWKTQLNNDIHPLSGWDNLRDMIKAYKIKVRQVYEDY